MANYESQVTTQPAVLDAGVNLNLVAKVLEAKQGQFDKNAAEIDSTLSEMKQNENLLLRDGTNSPINDKERFSSHINTILSVINRDGKMDVSSNGLTRQIKGSIKSVLNDDYIVHQIGIGVQKRNFDASMEEMKNSKNPKIRESYNTINHNDALKQAGLYDYMKGIDATGQKVDDIGTLQYHNYTNAPRDIEDRVQNWAKENGYHTSVESVDKGLFIQNSTHKSLSKDEIIGFIKNDLDPSTTEQLNINARHTYDNMSDEAFKTEALQTYESKNSDLTRRLAQQKANLATASGENLNITNKNITYLEDEISKVKSKIDNKQFDRNDKYSMYQNNLFNGIASTYAKDDVIKVDYDTTPLQIAKFQEDMRHNKADELMKAYTLDNKNSKGQAANTGTEIPVIPENDPNNLKKEEEKIRDNYVQTEAELKATLSQEDPEYKKLKTLEQRNTYVRHLMTLDPQVDLKSGNTLSANVISAIKNNKNNYEAYTKYINNISTNIDNLAKEQFDDMRGGTNLNKNNLGVTMPYTAEFLKKNKPFDSLRQDEQDLVKYERVANQLAFDDNLEPTEKAELKNYLNRLTIKNANNKWFQSNTKNLIKEEVGGSMKNFWTNGVYGTVGKELMNIGSSATGIIGNLYDKAFGTKEQELKNQAERNKTFQENQRDISQNYKVLKESMKDSSIFGMFYQDTNITEVDTREDTKSGKDLGTVFNDAVKRTMKSGREELSKYIPNLPEKNSFSFSTENKNQAPKADEIRQVILANKEGGVDLADKNNYNLNYVASEDAYHISYIEKDGKVEKTGTIVVPKKLMPKDIVDTYQTSISNWSTDIKNAKASIPTFVYNPPISLQESREMLTKLETIASNQFSSEDIGKLRNSALFDTPSDRFKAIYQTYPNIKNDPSKVEAINKLLNAKVDIQSFVVKGQGFQLIPVIKYQDGTEERVKKQITMIPEYDPSNNLKMQIMLTSGALDEKIKEIANE